MILAGAEEGNYLHPSRGLAGSRLGNFTGKLIKKKLPLSRRPDFPDVK